MKYLPVLGIALLCQTVLPASDKTKGGGGSYANTQTDDFTSGEDPYAGFDGHEDKQSVETKEKSKPIHTEGSRMSLAIQGGALKLEGGYVCKLGDLEFSRPSMRGKPHLTVDGQKTTFDSTKRPPLKGLLSELQRETLKLLRMLANTQYENFSLRYLMRDTYLGKRNGGVLNQHEVGWFYDLNNFLQDTRGLDEPLVLLSLNQPKPSSPSPSSRSSSTSSSSSESSSTSSPTTKVLKVESASQEGTLKAGAFTLTFDDQGYVLKDPEDQILQWTLGKGGRSKVTFCELEMRDRSRVRAILAKIYGGEKLEDDGFAVCNLAAQAESRLHSILKELGETKELAPEALPQAHALLAFIRDTSELQRRVRHTLRLRARQASMSSTTVQEGPTLTKEVTDGSLAIFENGDLTVKLGRFQMSSKGNKVKFKGHGQRLPSSGFNAAYVSDRVGQEADRWAAWELRCWAKEQFLEAAKGQQPMILFALLRFLDDTGRILHPKAISRALMPLDSAYLPSEGGLGWQTSEVSQEDRGKVRIIQTSAGSLTLWEAGYEVTVGPGVCEWGGKKKGYRMKYPWKTSGFENKSPLASAVALEVDGFKDRLLLHHLAAAVKTRICELLQMGSKAEEGGLALLPAMAQFVQDAGAVQPITLQELGEDDNAWALDCLQQPPSRAKSIRSVTLGSGNGYLKVEAGKGFKYHNGKATYSQNVNDRATRLTLSDQAKAKDAILGKEDPEAHLTLTALRSQAEALLLGLTLEDYFFHHEMVGTLAAFVEATKDIQPMAWDEASRPRSADKQDGEKKS